MCFSCAKDYIVCISYSFVRVYIYYNYLKDINYEIIANVPLCLPETMLHQLFY